MLQKFTPYRPSFLLLLPFWFGILLAGTVQAAPNSFAPMIKEVMPAVVNIHVEGSKQTATKSNIPQIPQGMEEFFRQFGIPLPEAPEEHKGRPGISAGSGFIIDESGIIVTNEHVIRGAEKIVIIVRNGNESEEFNAEIIGSDVKTDLAVLKFDNGDIPLKAVSFGDSDYANTGDWVVAIGNPLGRLTGTATAGIISARGRDIGAGPYDDFIQTDAAINQGNSGGPLFNTDGEVIGINTMIISPSGGSIGLGFAVPSNLAKNVIDQLLEFGTTRRGWLGVLIQDVSSEIAESMGDADLKGALVSTVTENGPAEAAGFIAGDLIIAFDGKSVESAQKLPILVAETPVGKRVAVTIIRDGTEQVLEVTLGQLEKAENNQLAAITPSDTHAEQDHLLGLELSEMTASLSKRFKLDSDIAGLVVLKVDKDSKAARVGIRPGDVVLKVNQTEVQTLEEVEDILEEAEDSDRKNVLLFLQTQEGSRFVALPLEG